MSYYAWKPYVPVAERRRQAEKVAAKARKSGADLSPIEPCRGAITKTFWGKAWSENLEAYSDYANRLPRGRTYVRNGSVIDLKIAQGEVQAQVMGSSLYKVAVKVAAVSLEQWQAIGTDCAGSIDSLVELLQGKLSTAVMQRICTPRTGLFPAPKEISFSCSCPDSASMCKHVAAVLYGVGARLDQQPELLFRLRQVDAEDLVSQAGAGLPKSNKGPAAGKVLDDSMLADVFGIELDETTLTTKDASPRKAPAPTKDRAKRAPKAASGTPAETSKKPAAIRKAAPSKKPVAAKPPAQDSATQRTPGAPASQRRSTPSKSASGKAREAVTSPAREKTGKTVRASKGD
ncbi:SWIM zinc finger family protein [Aromatoleum anaerobium]|uniref:SWIM-type domain-containing protein n=2 Tax=Aromatoleum TaxID=551759 RepID=A0ABX1PGY7_9RHOO|nr:SWIM zinc finger family protein [Aromatoleum anaerobium]MCK0509254.1 SWIM zinc finger family protein [Aromatoleum anaerobium]